MMKHDLVMILKGPDPRMVDIGGSTLFPVPIATSDSSRVKQKMLFILLGKQAQKFP